MTFLFHWYFLIINEFSWKSLHVNTNKNSMIQNFNFKSKMSRVSFSYQKFPNSHFYSQNFHFRIKFTLNFHFRIFCFDPKLGIFDWNLLKLHLLKLIFSFYWNLYIFDLLTSDFFFFDICYFHFTESDIFDYWQSNSFFCLINITDIDISN